MLSSELLEILPTVQDYQRSLGYSGWEKVSSSQSGFSSLDNVNALQQVINSSLSVDDKSAAAAITLILLVSLSPSMRAMLENPDVIDSLSKEQIDYLRQVTRQSTQPDLRVQLALFLWGKHNDYQFAEVAIRSYLEMVNTADKAIRWPKIAKWLEEALKLALNLGKKSSLREEVFQAISDELNQRARDSSYFTSQIIDALIKAGQKSMATTFVLLVEQAGECAEEEKELGRAERYWTLAGKLHEILGSKTDVQKAYLKVGDIHIREADKILNNPNHGAPNLHAQHSLELAVTAYRQVNTPEGRQKAQEVHARLLVTQKKGVNELIPIRSSVDITDIVEVIQKAFEGLAPLEAIHQLATIHTPLPVKELYRRSRSTNRNLHFKQFFPVTILGPSGMTVARQKNYKNDERARKRESRIVDMLQDGELNRPSTVQMLIMPALRQINQDNDLTEDDFLEIVQLCPLIRPERASIYARGFLEGARYDWLVSGHLLIPQLEESLRELLLQRGATPPVEVIEGKREWGMQEFLYNSECEEILLKFLGQNLLWDVRALLCEKYGANLRPMVAHGMLDDGAFTNSQFTANFVYLWWLCLHICFHFIRLRKQPVEPFVGR